MSKRRRRSRATTGERLHAAAAVRAAAQPSPVAAAACETPRASGLRAFELRAFVRWARGGAIVQGGRLADHFISDRVAFADRVLVEAELRGWIIRRGYNPTVEMRFFGVGGFRGRKAASAAPEDAYPVEFDWEVQLSAPVVEPREPTIEEQERIDASSLALDAHCRQEREMERLLAAAAVIDWAARL